MGNSIFLISIIVGIIVLSSVRIFGIIGSYINKTENVSITHIKVDQRFNPNQDVEPIVRENGAGHKFSLDNYGKNSDEINSKGINDYDEHSHIVATSEKMAVESVAENLYGISYISLGYYNSDYSHGIKAIPIDGVEPSVENIKNGSYEFTSPFYLTTKCQPDGITEDFIRFIQSVEGQEIISKDYIATVENPVPFKSEEIGGRLYINGSCVMEPLISELIEEYQKYNKMAKIELSVTNSITGVGSVLDGTCDIAMINRELTDYEEENLHNYKLAVDGICIIKNYSNPLDDISLGEVFEVFSDDVKSWEDLEKLETSSQYTDKDYIIMRD